MSRKILFSFFPHSLETFPAPQYNSPMPQQNLAQKIYAAVRLIPKGKVASYSQVAALAGNCNLRRYVGNALHKNPSNSVTPCHRVVNASGRLAPHYPAQASLLTSEGIRLTPSGKVPLKEYLWVIEC